jgi:hypothetical protein
MSKKQSRATQRALEKALFGPPPKSARQTRGKLGGKPRYCWTCSKAASPTNDPTCPHCGAAVTALTEAVKAVINNF